MKKRFSSCMTSFFQKDLDLRVRFFHVLAITGFIICVVMTIISIAGSMLASALINAGAGIISLSLLFYSVKKGHYPFCYMASIVVIFFILFSSLFFAGGGYHGGMPFFFVFAVVFTVYMLDGIKMLIVALLELFFYSGLFILAYLYPERIIPFDSQKAVMVDGIVGFASVSISLGVTMYVQIRMYQKQQRQLERAQYTAETANHAKSEFLANMSHEIRTPIHMILGMNEIILRESQGRQISEYSEKIDEASKMLLSLVDSILDVSKIESGKMELINADYETQDLVRALAAIGKTECEKKNLRFTCQVEDDLPPRLVGDLPHIQQIGVNFLSNASKYTQEGEVFLTISQKAGQTADEKYLVISVQDTGIGIRKEAIPHLFEAFNRADPGSHRQISGTGLGLSIVKKLTDLMGGILSVDSTLGHGSTFTVCLPQKVSAPQEIQKIPPDIVFLAPHVHILSVDDNEGNRMLMRKLLQPTQIQLDTASSGQECLELIRENTYHLILMDYMMPDMDGLENLKHLQKEPGFQTPVIALTADATPQTRQTLLNAGFTACLIKPTPWKQLRDELLRYLPQQLVLITSHTLPKSDNPEKIQELGKALLPYEIVLQEGLRYFQNSLEEYCTVAQVFLRHDKAERETVKMLQQKKDYIQLRFRIHALKGKARNLGLTRLAQVCTHIENLCSQEGTQEAESLLPYLMYLWELGQTGLYILCQKYTGSQSQKSLPVPDPLTQLPGLLKEFRRKPSLQCIEHLLEEEHDAHCEALLMQVQERINAIDFEQAEFIFQRYLDLRKEA